MKLDSHQLPKQYFEYFIGQIGVQVNSIKKVCHKAQPSYQGATLKISYKIFKMDTLLDVLEEQSEAKINTEELFAGNESCDGMDPVIYGMDPVISAEEEIARAKQRAHVPGNKRKRPSSKSSLVVGYGEGHATREIEIIWWPNLYTYTEHGQMVIRMYIEKCNF